MKHYTIGALFSKDFKYVLLIEKQRPAWQKGKLNFPGGHIEDGETAVECISREFEEETGLLIQSQDWKHIGKINNDQNYFVEFFATVYRQEYGLAKIKTDEVCDWYKCQTLPNNVITNLRWLVPFAINTFKQGDADTLEFGLFTYSYTK